MMGRLPALALLLLLLCTTCRAKVNGVDASIGETCPFADGSVGRCETVHSCMATEGVMRRNEEIIVCHDSTAVRTLVVCCRRPKQIAKKLCEAWQPYWQAASSFGDETCVTDVTAIYGGEEAALGEYPHMVALGRRIEPSDPIAWHCGGSLITPRYVMTAAHCIKQHDYKYFVGLGEHDLHSNNKALTKRLDFALPPELSDSVNGPSSGDTPIEQIIEVEHRIPYPDYERYYHDIALLLLREPAILTARVLPTCLPYKLENEEFSSDTQFSVAGWGSTNYGSSPGKAKPRMLLRAHLGLVDSIECSKRILAQASPYALPWGITSDLICAGAKEKDTCQGDSGGPLMDTTRRPDNIKCSPIVTVGVIVFGHGCKDLGAYTRASAYLDWILGVVAPKMVQDL